MENPVAAVKEQTRMAKERLLKTFSFVPEEKLTWSPSPTAKSALQILAHTGTSNQSLAALLRGEPGGAEEHERLHAAEAAITTRAQAVQLIEESTEEVLAALDTLTPERIASMVETPWLTAPMPFFMGLPALHMQGHAAQIDYLQTIWGDEQFHM
ncbi:MAG: DinB family protein [Armatimonadetes bacterium]|jgi:nicotinic acid phosphoribosyltransferase|nr:DinB family protein [Armatimonadota bacterium]